ncbi:MAG: CBS domain-containing protein [archaeon]|nr:CBS domain-containing protein [archaeon]
MDENQQGVLIMKIKEIMNRAMAVESDISLKDAAKIMSDKNIGSIVIIKNGKLSGIITESDIIKNVCNLNKKISSVMSKNVVTINENEELNEVATLMKKNSIKRLPVISENGKIVGIVTSTDLIANSDELNEDFLLD